MRNLRGILTSGLPRPSPRVLRTPAGSDRDRQPRGSRGRRAGCEQAPALRDDDTGRVGSGRARSTRRRAPPTSGLPRWSSPSRRRMWPGQLSGRRNCRPIRARSSRWWTPIVFRSEQSFINEVNRELAKRPPGQRTVLVFIHGYNTSTSDAVLRLGQFVEDSGFTGVPVLFTWASAAQVPRYVYDLNSALIARVKIKEMARDPVPHAGRAARYPRAFHGHAPDDGGARGLAAGRKPPERAAAQQHHPRLARHRPRPVQDADRSAARQRGRQHLRPCLEG